jgi:DUF1016 N-terminal domain
VPQSSSLTAAYIDVRSGIFVLLKTIPAFVVARSVNSLMVDSYWGIGRRVVKAKYIWKRHSGYSDQLIERLSLCLTQQLVRGFSLNKVENIHRFFFAYPAAVISETLSRICSNRSINTISATAFGKLRLSIL